MKKKKMGRPRVFKNAAMSSLISCHFTASQSNRIRAAARRDGITLSKWVRTVLLACV